MKIKLSKFNILVAIEVLVEPRGVRFHLLFCIRVILGGETILRLKVWVVVLLLFVGGLHQSGICCMSEERLTADPKPWNRVL